MRYETSSHGGLQLFADYVAKLQAALADEKPVALIRLTSSHYQHSQWGRVYTPVWDYVEWRRLDDASGLPASGSTESQADPVSPQEEPSEAKETAASGESAASVSSRTRSADKDEDDGSPPPPPRRRRPRPVA